jgi:hypothetical protein
MRKTRDGKNWTKTKTVVVNLNVTKRFNIPIKYKFHKFSVKTNLDLFLKILKISFNASF